MGRVKQSFCYGCYLREPLTLKDLIKGAAEIGYEAVELWWRFGAPLEEIAELAGEYGLAIASMSGHQSLPDGLNKPENHDRIEDELHESIDVAAKYGIPGLICFSGNRHSLSDNAAAVVVAEGLSRVIKHAEEKNVNLNVELLNSKINHPLYQCDHTDWGVLVCKLVNSPKAKLLFDIYHMQIMEGDLIRNIRDNIQYIGHFHTAGNPDRRDLDDEQEICYPAVFRAIADAGYEYYAGHEYSPKGDVLASLRQAYETCSV